MVCRIPSRRAASIALCGLLHLPGLSAVDPECRDRFYWPFSNASIWNTPIGSNASFVPAEIYNISYSVGCALRIGAAASLRTVCPGWNTTWTPAVCLTVGCCYDPITPDPNDVPWCYRPGGRPPQWGFHNDGDLIVLSTASNPLVPWLNQGNWNPGNHCSATGPQATAVPLPADFVTPCGGGNNAMALLLPDNCTLVQMQPAFRQDAESPLLALYHEGGPVPFPWEISITGDGAAGAHGGSGLSSMGGTIRSGELRPSSPPLRHALKLELFAHDYYFSNGTAAPYTEVSRCRHANHDLRPRGFCTFCSAFGGQHWAVMGMHMTRQVHSLTTAPYQVCSLARCWLFRQGGSCQW